MAKIGVGVGEEFPVDEANKAEPPPEGGGPRHACGWGGGWGRLGWVHFTLFVLLRLAIIALVVGAAWSLFHPYPFAYGPYGYRPYPHHFFFPFFPVLLIALFAVFLLRRGHRHRWRHWHDGPRGPGSREEA